MKNWIDTLTHDRHAAAIDRARPFLITAAYLEPEDFEGVTADELMRDVQVTRPVAVAILRAAADEQTIRGRASAPAVSAAPAVVVLQPEDEHLRRERLLAQLDDPARRQAAAEGLRGLGVRRVVVEGERVDLGRTGRYLAEGAPLVSWYEDGRVVDLDEVGREARHHPRTGARLGGADVVPWRNLSPDDLVAAAALYLEGLDAGEGERSVFADVCANGPMVTAARRRLADPKLRRLAQARIAGEVGEALAVAADVREIRRPVTAIRDGGSRRGHLRAMLLERFSADEIRTQVAPESLRSSLPGAVAAPVTVADALVDALERSGWAADPLFWPKIVALRPRAATQIASVARLYGVEL